jgi:hypothetical protein
MLLAGHFVAHVLQFVHLRASIFATLFSSVIAFAGQERAHSKLFS